MPPAPAVAEVDSQLRSRCRAVRSERDARSDRDLDTPLDLCRGGSVLEAVEDAVGPLA